MSRHALFVLALMVSLGGAAVWFLVREEGGARGAGPAALRGRDAPVERAARTLPAPEAARSSGGAEHVEPAALDAPAAPAASAPTSAPREQRVLTGVVLRLADGSPLAGWRVRAPLVEPGEEPGDADPPRDAGASPHDDSVGSALLDERGAFELLAFSDPAPTELVVQPPDPESTRRVRVPLPDAPFEAALELRADTGWIVEGRVRSDAGGALTDARVLVEGALPPRADCDAAGAFRALDVVPVDPAIGLSFLAARAELHGIEERELLLRDAERVVTGLDFELTAAGAVEGRLVGPDGVAHPYARVSLLLRLHDDDVELVSPRLRSEPPPHAAFTAELGRRPGERADDAARAADALDVHYRVDSVPPGRYVLRVETPAPDADAPVDPSDLDALRRPPERWLDDVQVAAGEVTRLDIALQAGAAVLGRVVDDAGVGMPGVSVRAELLRSWELPALANSFSSTRSNELRMEKVSDPDGGGRETIILPLRSVSTDTDGAFRLGQLPAGAVRLRASVPGSQPLERELQLTAGELRQGVELAYGAGLTLEGRVVGPDGLPVVGAWVELGDVDHHATSAPTERVDTDERGRFVLRGLGPELVRLSYGADGYDSADVELRPGEPVPDLVLVPVPFLRGTIVDARSGEPVRRFEFRTETLGQIRSSTNRSPEGRFEIPAVNEQPVRLVISAPGYREWSKENVVPSYDPGVTLLVRLEPDE